MERSSFVMYRSYAEVMAELSDEDAGILFKALSKYALDGEEPELTGYLSGYFKLIRPQIDANNQKYKNGTKGGRHKSEEEPKENQTETKPEPSGNQTRTKEEPNTNQAETKPEPNENVNENENVNDIKKSAYAPKKRFAPPTLEEVQAYCRERRNSVDARRFLDYYESNGWRVGKNPMKDWKATVRTWERNGFDKPQAKPEGDRLLDEVEQLYLKGGTQ